MQAGKLIQTETNVVAGISFRAAKAYANPFMDVAPDVVFTDPEGNRKTVPAFRAGGDEWVVRYASPLTGTHQYRSVSSDAEDSAQRFRAGWRQPFPAQERAHATGKNRERHQHPGRAVVHRYRRAAALPQRQGVRDILSSASAGSGSAGRTYHAIRRGCRYFGTLATGSGIGVGESQLAGSKRKKP